MKSEKIKSAIKTGIFIMVLVTLLIGVIVVMVQYDQEGEKNMPFKLSKITILSTASGTEENGENKEPNWKLNLLQNNDVYLSITKNEENKEEVTIESIRIDNIKIVESPKVGEIKAYMPNSSDGDIYTYKQDTEITDGLEYKGSSKDNPKTLEISNMGGNILISFANVGLGKFESNNEVEIKHDGSLLQKAEKKIDDLKFKVSFDLTIRMKGKNYKSNVILDMPCGNILEEGKSIYEITDTSNIVFKREK